MSESTRLPRFMQLQQDFAAHLREPQRNPAPAGLEDRRMKIYRELFYNNVENFITKGFPVLRSLFSNHAWHGLVRDFYSRHRSKSPFFHGIGREFLDFLQEERGRPAGDPPFMLELAHYEWVEMALAISELEADMTDVDTEGDLVSGVPVVSPLAWSLAYQYPVHRISPEFRPVRPPAQPTYIVVYRDRNDEVGFLEVNAVTARLLQLIELEPNRTGQAQLEVIATELQHPNPMQVVASGREMLAGLHQRDIVLGARKGLS